MKPAAKSPLGHSQSIENYSSDPAAVAWGDMRERWSRGDCVRVEHYLSDPKASTDPDLVLDLIYAEYVLSEEAGIAVSVKDYVTRFPYLSESIIRQLTLHDGLSAAATDYEDCTQSFHNSTTDHNSGDRTDLASELPQTIGKYRVISELGAGGQGSVYRAVHPELGKDVVLKVAHKAMADNSSDHNRTEAEGKILAGLKHPSLASIHDLAYHEGRPVLVMEYIPGRSLDQVVRQGHISPQKAAEIGAAIARAVGYAHSRGVAHLDIKPANILIGDDGIPRLIDFGLGRRDRHWEASLPEKDGGTIAYIAPERMRGLDGSCERVDVFGLGTLLYFMLTGNPPFRGDSAAEVWEKARNCEWDRQALERPEVPAALRVVCTRCMAKDPDERFPDADTVATELDRIWRPRRFSRRAAIAAMVGIVGAGIVYARYRNSEPVPPPPTPDPKLHVRVWNTDHYEELVGSLPLQAGDELRIELDALNGFYVSLLWADTEGKVHELDSTTPEHPRALQFPKEMGHSSPIAGAPGTEFIVACARRDRPVDLAKLRAELQHVQNWPKLPGSLLLFVGREGVTRVNGDRGPGPLKLRVDPEQEVKDRLRALQQSLEGECEVLVGLSFAHK